MHDAIYAVHGKEYVYGPGSTTICEFLCSTVNALLILIGLLEHCYE